MSNPIYGAYENPTPNESRILHWISSKYQGDYAKIPASGITTVLEGFKNSVNKFGDWDCLGWIEGEVYRWMDYKLVNHKAECISKALIKLDLCPTKEDLGRTMRMIGIFASNSPQWTIVWIAATMIDCTIASIPGMLGIDGAGKIIN